MQKVTVYKANDGSLHETSESCRMADERGKLRKWYSENELLGNYSGSRVEFDDIVEWLIVNEEKATSIIKTFGV